MLVKEGHKKSYIIFGILQLLLAIACIGLMMPYMLSDCGIIVQNWVEFADKIKNLSFEKYIFTGFNFIPLLLFIFTIISIIFRKSGASIFVKLSSVVAIFPVAIRGLEYGIYALTEKTMAISSMFSGFITIFFIASIIFLIIGLIFQFSVSKTSPNKANIFQIMKALFWIVILGFNFIFADLLEKSAWIKGLLGYVENSLPYFLCWMFLILGILELACSAKIIEAKDSKIGVKTSFQTSQTVTTNYVPQSQDDGMAANPVAPSITINQTFQGIPQGLESEEQPTEAESVQTETSETNANLASPENTSEQPAPEKPKAPDYNEDSGLLSHRQTEERTESYLEKLEKLTERLEQENNSENNANEPKTSQQEVQQNTNEQIVVQNDEAKVNNIAEQEVKPTVVPPIPAQPVQTEQPAQQTPQITQAPQVEKAQPTTPVQPAAPTVQPVEPENSVQKPQSTAPAETVTQVQQTTPTEAVTPVQPTTPTETVAPTQATQPVNQAEQPVVKKPRGRPKKVITTNDTESTTN